jgi:hypothetical protein
VNAKADEKDEAERRQHQHDRRIAAKDRLTERRQPSHRAAADLDRGTARHLIGQPRGNACEGDATGHEVVDADHISAQAHISDSGPLGAVATAGSYVPVKVRHRSLPLSIAPTAFRRLLRGGI